jgi:hypothetical protein
MSEYLIKKAFEVSPGKVNVAVEVPPGVGKTYYGVKKALELAANGRVVIFALPNHQALITAFAYAVKHFKELTKTLPKRRWPYIVYYEGIERFCPLLRDPRAFNRALRWAKNNNMIDQDTYDLLSKLSAREAIGIYGSNTVCKKMCPVYNQQLNFNKEKIFVTRTVAAQSELVGLLSSKVEQSRVTEAMGILNELRVGGLVAELDPSIDARGAPQGYCVRAVLQKALNKKKTQLVMKGALILTPMQALEFILSVVISRIKLLRNRGLAIPMPLVIVDEYDSFVYKPNEVPIFSIHQIRAEKEIALEIIQEEADKRRSGDPDYNWERLVAALVAYRILSMLEEDYNEFMENAKSKEENLNMGSSPANIIAECAATPLASSEAVAPPFAPRRISFAKYQGLTAQLYDFLEQVEEEKEEEEGLVFYDMDDVRSRGIKYFISLWENIVVVKAKEENRVFLYPALYRVFSNVYNIGYVYLDKHKSIAAAFARFISRLPRKSVLVHYKVMTTRRKIYNSRGKLVGEGGGYLLHAIYDSKILSLLESDADVILMSATGLPWLSDFYATRSAGEGAVVYGRRFIASKRIMDVFSSMEEKERANVKTFSYYILKSPHLSKDIAIIMLDDATRSSYASHGVIIPVRDLGLLPFSGGGSRYLVDLMNALKPYISVLSQVAEHMVARREVEGRIPAALVLCQRKDISEVLTYMLADALVNGIGGAVEVLACNGNNCEKLGRRELYPLLVSQKQLSHFVIEHRVRRVRTRYYITWLRSKMSRGIDLPDDTVALAVVLVGTPYRPPQAFDILPRKVMEAETVRRASFIAIRIFVGAMDPKNMVLLVHNPVDIAESVNEFVQAVGRALRRAWGISAVKGRKAYTVAIIIPALTYNKIYNYSPLWFRDIFATQG